MIITALHSILSTPSFTHLTARNCGQGQIVTLARTDVLQLADAVADKRALQVPTLQGGALTLKIEPAGRGNRFDELQFVWASPESQVQLFSLEDYGDHRTLLAEELRANQSAGENPLRISLWQKSVIIHAGTQALYLRTPPAELLSALRNPHDLPTSDAPLCGVNVMGDEIEGYACWVVSAEYITHRAPKFAGRLLLSLPELRRAQLTNQNLVLYGDKIIHV